MASLSSAASLLRSAARRRASRSRSSYELSGLERSKVTLLVVLLVIGLVGASWKFFRDPGVGNPEDAAKVLVVTEDGNHKPFLQGLGFIVDAQTFETLESKAWVEVPELDDHGVVAIMALADRFGYGYVVFERPYNFDFSPLRTADGPVLFKDGDRFAVVSAGDLAKPHRVTQGSSLLPTLFEQQQLAEIVTPTGPSGEAARLRGQLRAAVKYLERGPRRPRRSRR